MRTAAAEVTLLPQLFSAIVFFTAIPAAATRLWQSNAIPHNPRLRRNPLGGTTRLVAEQRDSPQSPASSQPPRWNNAPCGGATRFATTPGFVAIPSVEQRALWRSNAIRHNPRLRRNPLGGTTRLVAEQRDSPQSAITRKNSKKRHPQQKISKKFCRIQNSPYLCIAKADN
ncbi:MAG: hypothetical protein K2L31_09830 [Muribaculum sp.]|nr:hypothetical protein [Muribaculum sp.]